MMQNSIQILLACESFLPKIAEIEQKSFSIPWSTDSFQHELDCRSSHFAAAVLNGEVVGFCILRIFDYEGEIFNIAVSKEYRGQRIGERLLSEALEFADKNGVKTIFLEVRKSNVTALELYKKHGFTILGIRRNYYDAPKEDAILMNRTGKEN